jgi:3-deoxy-D-manno-octulosonic-acid transferase
VRVTGNLKFDAAAPDATSGPDVPGLLRQIGVNNNARLLVAGSTHAGEESRLAEMLPRLRGRFPDLFLVLVPRHFERAGSVARSWTARGVKFIRRSDITPETRLPLRRRCNACWSTARANSSFSTNRRRWFLWARASPRAADKTHRTGGAGQGDGLRAEHAEFYAPSSAPSWRPGAPSRCAPAAELEQALAQLLADDALRARLGGRARQVVQDNLGATRRTVEMILETGAGVFSEEIVGPVKRRAALWDEL